MKHEKQKSKILLLCEHTNQAKIQTRKQKAKQQVESQKKLKANQENQKNDNDIQCN